MLPELNDTATKDATMSCNKLISIEFNELCPTLMNRFMAAGKLPYFKRLHDQSEVFETDAEESGELLNPWVQWVTVHTGLSAAEHQVTTLNERPQPPVPFTWDILSAAGFRVWVCGSMNGRYEGPLNGALLPDPWCFATSDYPPGEFGPFVNYVRSAVQEHTGGGGQGSFSEFARFMLKRGLSGSTVIAATRQIISERRRNTKWRRARILDLFQWDLFRYYYRKLSPDFATFFLNSTAHFQHCYWRNFEPEKFSAKPSPKEQKDFATAILYGYQCMDKLIGQFIRLAGKDVTLVFSTGLSQQPYLDHEDAGGRHYYHIIDKQKLLSPLGLEQAHEYEPLMAEQFVLRFRTDCDLELAERRLANFHVKHAAVFSDTRTRLFHITRKERTLVVSCRCTRLVPADAAITHSGENELSIAFYDVFYQMPATKSGRHHPAGMLWIRHADRQGRTHPGRVSIRSIAPTILSHFGVDVPLQMRAEALSRTQAAMATV